MSVANRTELSNFIEGTIKRYLNFLISQLQFHYNKWEKDIKFTIF